MFFFLTSDAGISFPSKSAVHAGNLFFGEQHVPLVKLTLLRTRNAGTTFPRSTTVYNFKRLFVLAPVSLVDLSLLLTWNAGAVFSGKMAVPVFEIVLWWKSVSLVDLSLLLNSNAGSIISSSIAVHVLKLFFVSNCFPCRLAPRPHQKRGNHMFKQNWCPSFELVFVRAQLCPVSTCPFSSLETREPLCRAKSLSMFWNLFLGEQVFPLSTCPPPPPHCKCGNHCFKSNGGSCFETCYWWNIVFPCRPAPRPPLPKRGNNFSKHNYFSWSERCVFATTCFLCRPVPPPRFKSRNCFFKQHSGSCFDTCFWRDKVFLSPTCPSSSLQTMEPVVQATNLFLGETMFPLSTCLSSSSNTRESRCQGQWLFRFWNLCLVNNSFLCWPVPSPHLKRGNQFLNNIDVQGLKVVCRWTSVSLVDLSLLLISNARTTFPSNLAVHALKLVCVKTVSPVDMPLLLTRNAGTMFSNTIVGHGLKVFVCETLCPLSTCSSSWLQTREPIVAAKWPFMCWNVLLDEHVCFLSNCPSLSLQPWEPLFQAQSLSMFWKRFLVVQQCSPWRLACPHHAKCGNIVFERTCCSWFESYFCVSNTVSFVALPLPLTSSAGTAFSSKTAAHVLKLVLWWQRVYLLDLSLLLTSNARAARSSNIAGHVLELVFVMKQCFPCRLAPHPHRNVESTCSSKLIVHGSKFFFLLNKWVPLSTCPSSSLQTREPRVQTTFLFMFRNLLMNKCFPCRPAPHLRPNSGIQLLKHNCCSCFETCVVLWKSVGRADSPPSHLKRGNLFCKQTCCSCFEIVCLCGKGVSLVDLSIFLTLNASITFWSRIVVHCLKVVSCVNNCFLCRPVPPPPFKRGNHLVKQKCWPCVGTCFLVKHCFSCRPAITPHPKRGNHLFTHNSCSCVETCLFSVNKRFPCQPASPPHPKRGNHIFQANLMSMVWQVCCLWNTVSFIDLSLFLTSDPGILCSSTIAVHVSKLALL